MELVCSRDGDASASSRPCAAIVRTSLAQKSFGELGEPLISLTFCPGANVLHERAQLFFSPVVSGGALRAARVARPRALEQSLGGGLVVSWIFMMRERVAFRRISPGAGIFLNERA